MNSPAFSRTELHRGKRNAKIEITFSDELESLLIAKAHGMGITKTDLAHECFVLGLTGAIYSVHVANDKAESIKAIHRELREISGKEGESL